METHRHTISETVTPALTTVHLPPERAVLTTPGMVGLMERCIDAGEDEDGWESRSVEVRHRAGLRTGEQIELTAELIESSGQLATWRVTGTRPDGAIVGEATIVRERIG